MRTRAVGNLLGLAVLSYLTQGPMHAYAMQRHLRDNDAAATFKLSYGALYSVFGQLVRAGFVVEQGTGRDGNRPERTVYALTDAGRAEMHDWLAELVAEPQPDFPRFGAALSLIAVLRPAQVVGLLGGRLERIREQQEQIRGTVSGALEQGVHPLFLVEDDYRLDLLNAEIAFIERFITAIDDPDRGWAAAWDAFHLGATARPAETAARADADGHRTRRSIMTRTAVIIGGGVAGPATAMALQRVGIEATVHETRPEGADGGGVMLTVATNGIDALQTLDLAEQVLAQGFPTPAITLRSYTGKVLGQTRTGGTSGIVSHTIKRADLYRVLADEAGRRGIGTCHGHRLVDVEDTGTGVRATFQDGSEAVGDVLIGCDGVRSTVRGLIDPAAPAPVYSGLVTTGGYARGIAVDGLPGDYQMIFGRRAFFGYAIARDGEVWWFVNVPRSAEPGRGELGAIGEQEWRREFVELYAGDAGPALDLISATPEFPAPTAIHAIPHLPRWHRGRMVVIGDAAHAPSPTSGQGASLAVEDAVALAGALSGEADPSAAFARFETDRRGRVEKIIKAAARINNSKAPGPVGRAIRDATLPTILRMTARSTAMDEVFDHHIALDPVGPLAG